MFSNRLDNIILVLVNREVCARLFDGLSCIMIRYLPRLFDDDQRTSLFRSLNLILQKLVRSAHLLSQGF